MNIYFAGSIRGGRDKQEFYLHLINHLKKHGKVLTEFVGAEDPDLHSKKEWKIKEFPSDELCYETDVSFLNKSDAIVAEVSIPSLGVGYEIALAESQGKRILCLYHTPHHGRISAMIMGNKKLSVKKYNDLDEAYQIIDEFFKS